MVKSVNIFFWPRDLDLETLKSSSGNENDTNQVRCCKQQYNRQSSFVSNGNLTSADRLTLCRSIRNAECSVRWRKEFKKSQGVTFLPGSPPPPPTRFLVRPLPSSRAAVALTLQARIHTGFPRFTEMGQIFPYRYIFNKERNFFPSCKASS